MFVSTLDGQFLAVYRDTGRVLWAMKQDPVLKMTTDVSKGTTNVRVILIFMLKYPVSALIHLNLMPRSFCL